MGMDLLGFLGLSDFDFKYLWWGLSIIVLVGLWIATKIPWVLKMCEAGLLNLGAKFGGRVFTRVAAEVMNIVWLLFGKPGEDENGEESTYSEQTLRRMVNAAIAIDASLVIISFVGSFTASRAFALTHGISSAVAFGIPFAVDGGALLCIVVIFIMALAGLESQKARIGLIILTSVSVLFNVAHISENGMSLQIFLLGVIFPGVLFGSTELLSDLIRAQMRRSSSIKTLEELQERVDGLKMQEVEVQERLDVALNQIEDAREQYAEVMEQVGIEMAAHTNGKIGVMGIQEQGADLKLMLSTNGGMTFDEIVAQSSRGLSYVKTTLRYLMTTNVIEFKEDKFGLILNEEEVAYE